MIPKTMYAIFCSHEDCIRLFGPHSSKKTLLEAWKLNRKALHWTVTKDHLAHCAKHNIQDDGNPGDPLRVTTNG